LLAAAMSTCSEAIARLSQSRRKYQVIEMIGWGARIRTWEWRNQNPTGLQGISECIPKNLADSSQVISKGYPQFRNVGRCAPGNRGCS
jgi:hypothetical protein